MAEIVFTNGKRNCNLKENHECGCEISDILKRLFEITEEHGLGAPMTDGLLRVLSNRDTKIIHVDSLTSTHATNAFYIQGKDPEEVREVYELIFEHYNGKGYKPANYRDTDDIKELRQ